LQEVEPFGRASYAFRSVAQPTRPAADAGITIGQVFLGKYRVDAVLGHGGMGVVVKATHLGLNDPVAIKMLRQDVLLDRDATERFMREAQAASKLRSEHVARVVDVGTFPDSGVPYMVMEFLDGHDLGELIEQRGTIPAPWCSMLMLQAAEALAEAHSIGVVHRDVKPSNLFVTWRPDGTAIVKVLDFGISKAPMGTDMQLTQTQSLLGTPAYMSPEQMRSARLVDARTDIWSLGTVMYELLEGRRPFEADSFSEMCVKVAVDAPEPMTKTPPAVQQVVLRCLAKSPDQRYASMAELGRDLVPFVSDVNEATLLVERMQRVLGRRSHVDWETSTGTSGSRTPQNVRDIGSAPIAVPWHGDPSALRNTPAQGVPTFTRQHDSAPARSPSEVFVAPKRSKWPAIVLVGFIAAGVGIGLAVALGDKDKAAGKATTFEVNGPMRDPAKEITDKLAKDAAAAKETMRLATEAANKDKEAADKEAADKDRAAKMAKEAADEIEISRIKKPAPAVIVRRPYTGVTVKKEPKETKPPVKDPKDTPKEPPKPECNVYDRLPGGGCPPKPTTPH